MKGLSKAVLDGESQGQLVGTLRGWVARPGVCLPPTCLPETFEFPQKGLKRTHQKPNTSPAPGSGRTRAKPGALEKIARLADQAPSSNLSALHSADTSSSRPSVPLEPPDCSLQSLLLPGPLDALSEAGGKFHSGRKHNRNRKPSPEAARGPWPPGGSTGFHGPSVGLSWPPMLPRLGQIPVYSATSPKSSPFWSRSERYL